MTSPSIDRLHREASEHYLSGDFPAAIRVWKRLLAEDPGHAEALEGVRMASQLCDPAELPEDPAAPALATEMVPPAPVAAVGHTTNESEIDSSLDAFFGLLSGPSPAAPAPPRLQTAAPPQAAAHGAAPRVVETQREGIDFGEIGDVAPIPLAPAASHGTSADSAPRDDDPGDGRGLAVVTEAERRPRGASGVAPTPAALELRRRVGALLREVKDKIEAGDRDEALGIIARIYILDEDNEDAKALETQIRAEAAEDLEAIERWLTEGIQAFDDGRRAEAREFFERVLQKSPEHREALEYLEAIGDVPAIQPRVATPPSPDDLFGETDLLGGVMPDAGLPPMSSEPPPPLEPESIPLDLGPGPVAPDAGPVPPPRDGAHAAAAPVLSAKTSRRRDDGAFNFPTRSRRVPRWAFVAAGTLAIGAVGAVLVPRFLGGKAPPDDSPAVDRVASAGPRAKDPGPAEAVAPSPGAAPEMPATDPVATTVPAALANGRRALASKDYAGAVVAFNQALRIDASNDEAREGLSAAAEAYKAQKAIADQFDRVRTAFEDGEYASGLRVLYRLPEGADRAKAERWKVVGWFNLGLVALRAGEPAQAIVHFDEVLAIGRDQDAEAWKAFATRYREIPKDRSYYVKVESAPFRRLDG